MDFRRIIDIFPYQKAKYPNKVSLACRQELQWQHYSTEDCMEQFERVSAGMLELGLNRGDKVAIMTPYGSPVWNFLDIGMQQIGIIVVPIHASITNRELLYVLNDAGVQYCIVQNRELHQRLKALQANVLSLKKIFTIEKLPDIPYWKELSIAPTAKHLADMTALRAAIHEDDLATIIYTSGTTGDPKGVMLSHKNIVSNIKATLASIPLNCDKRALSFLPMSHVFERMVTYTYMAAGASIYYTEDIANLTTTMREIRPHYFTAVPRLLEKAYDHIQERAKDLPLAMRKVLNWAVRVGEQYPDRRISPMYWWRLKLAELLVFRIWRRATGRKIEGVIVGAAALQPNLARLFTAAGFNIKEGYGLTETSPVVAFNRFEPGGHYFGTVGMPLPGVEVRIAEPDEEGEGEIQVCGPNVMLGYYNKPEATTAIFTADGWLKTGDIGKFQHKHFLSITDRKKDIFKTSQGKYVAPQHIEQILKASPYIEQCMIVGHNRSFVAVLLVPNFVMLEQWCAENKVHWTAPQFMVLNNKVEQFYEQLIEDKNEALNAHEKIRRIILLHEEWTVQDGAFTLTMKVKRPVLLARFRKEIEAVYE